MNSCQRSIKGKLHLTNLVAFYKELNAAVDGGGDGVEALKDMYELLTKSPIASLQLNYGKMD